MVSQSELQRRVLRLRELGWNSFLSLIRRLLIMSERIKKISYLMILSLMKSVAAEMMMKNPRNLWSCRGQPQGGVPSGASS
jgi:hypothetical protein